MHFSRITPRSHLREGLLIVGVVTLLAACTPPVPEGQPSKRSEAQPPDDRIVVGVPATMERTMPRVVFSHDQHREMECSLCHHAGPAGTFSCSASGCHTKPAPRSDALSCYAAFHADSGPSCLNCHTEEKTHGHNQDVPLHCASCHIPNTTD